MPSDHNYSRENFRFLPDHEHLIINIANEGTVVKFQFADSNWDFGLRLADEEFPFFEEINVLEQFQTRFDDLRLISKNAGKGKSGGFREITLFTENGPSIRVLYSKIFAVSDVSGRRDDEMQPARQECEIYLKFDTVTGRLYFSYHEMDGINFNVFLDVDFTHRHFRIFSFNQSVQQLSRIDIEPLLIREEKSSAFRIGDLVVRRGDMFNSDAVLNSNVVIIPASDLGTVSSALSTRVKELDIPEMTKFKAGEIELYQVSNKENFYAGYAYSVMNEESDPGIIEGICKNILEFIYQHSVPEGSGLKGINLPLLGTGAGGLDPASVMDIYVELFKITGSHVPVIVSIPSVELFDLLSEKFLEQSVPLIHEFRNAKPPGIAKIESLLKIEIPSANFEVDYSGNLVRLDLQSQGFILDEFSIPELEGIQSLNLDNSKVSGLEFLAYMRNLKYLSLRGATIADVGFLGKLVALKTLDFSFQKIRFPYNLIEGLVNLNKLVLVGNGIHSIDFVKYLVNLESLDLSQNQITDIGPVSSLKKLRELNLSSNIIIDVRPALSVVNLLSLDISNNRVMELPPLATFRKIRYLRADQNPFMHSSEIFLPDSGNHLAPLTNYLSRQAETKKIPVRLPAKILLLGNHASGKTSFLKYMQSGKLAGPVASTHIINIQKFPNSGQDLPAAIFYDFGGQDYYHGIYRAFLSGGAINLLLYNSENNRNKLRIDSKERITQDFSLDYWLAQKHYLEMEQYNGVISPTLLIQTHADIHKKHGYRSEIFGQEIENDFFVSLRPDIGLGSEKQEDVRKKALKYLKSSLVALIERNQIKREEPQWYIDFLKYVIRENSRADYKGKELKEVLRYYKRNIKDRLEALKIDLEQLHSQGLILYYRKEIPDRVWLNPVALVNHVHDNLLNTEVITKSNGLVPLTAFGEDQKDVVEMLISQKVLFVHNASNHYIVPNFLPLAKKATAEFELYTFGLGEPIFTLKFKHFLPFGLINQIICFFGDLPEEKKFWRDRLIFTLDGKAKVLINIDFQLLTIQVYSSFITGTQESEKQGIVKYLFYGILGMYWNQDLLKFKDFIAFVNGMLKLETFDSEDPIYEKILNTENLYENPGCRPMDLYISINQRDFINYSDLCSVGDSVMINSLSIDKAGGFDGRNKAIPVYPFQSFTRSDLKRRKNVAISYSKKDLLLVNKFRDFLVPLYDDELINHPWYCTELVAGTDWDEEIQRKFDDADIIFFMITENLMSTKYVMENEVKNAIDKYDRGMPIKIVPILLVPYHFARRGTYNLARFSALPYTLEPVILFQHPSEAWHTISESIRFMIEKDLDPGKEDELPAELKLYFEKIIRAKFMGEKTVS